MSRTPLKHYAITISRRVPPGTKVQNEVPLRSHETVIQWLIKVAKHYIFQGEEGGTGYPHFQGYIELEARKRIQTLAKETKALTDLPVHFSPASSEGIEALKKYCMKKDTRTEGPWQDGKPIYEGEDLYTEPYPWQKTLEELIDTTPDKRSIIWVYDQEGNQGKSEFVKKMFILKKAGVLSYGKTSDMLNIVKKHMNCKAFLVDLTRAKPLDIGKDDLYATIEQIKNGMVIASKYDGDSFAFRSPHVIVMANHLPNFHTLSNDRWKVKTIKEKALITLSAEEIEKELQRKTPPAIPKKATSRPVAYAPWRAARFQEPSASIPQVVVAGSSSTRFARKKNAPLGLEHIPKLTPINPSLNAFYEHLRQKREPKNEAEKALEMQENYECFDYACA